MNKGKDKVLEWDEFITMVQEVKTNRAKQNKQLSEEERIIKRSGLGDKVKPKQKGGRGLSFEKRIESTNKYYEDKGIAYVRKIPTPITVLKLNNKGRIEDGFYQKVSALDFNGIVKGGKHIDFDTKETRQKTAFPFKNVSEHQWTHMHNVDSLNGIAFLLVNFKELQDECYVLRYQDYISYIKDNPSKSSIEIAHFREKLSNNRVSVLETSKGKVYDYMKVVALLYDIKL